MTTYSLEIYKVVDSALTELNNNLQSGRTPNNPLSEAHYLAAWITNSMKKKRFDNGVVPTLKKWQQQARSLGKNANLKSQFIHLKSLYDHVLTEDKQCIPVTILQLNNLLDAMREQDWVVHDENILNGKYKLQTQGQDSLLVCAEQLKTHFSEDGQLIKPLSLYVRGQQQHIIDTAFDNCLLLHKVTDYKSMVKYHGEYIIYPNNSGDFLPELTTLETED